MRIRRKLSLAFGFILFLVLILTCLILWGLKKTHWSQERLRQALSIAAAVHHVDSTVNSEINSTIEFVALGLYGESGQIEDNRQDILDQFVHWEQLALQEIATAGEEQRSEYINLIALREICLDLFTACEQAANLKKQGRDAEARRLLEDIIEQKHRRDLMPIMERIVSGEHTEAIEVEAASKKILHFITVLSGAIALLGSVSAGVVLFLLAKAVSIPIEKLCAVTREVGKGNLDASIDVTSNDEIGDLAASFKQMLSDLKTTTTSVHSLNREVERRRQTEHALKKANNDLQKVLHDLKFSNEELQDFAYIISHDLKAPLRGITALADWMSTDYSDKLDEQGREQMSLLVSRVGRMHDLIDGVLQYSRVGRAEENRSRVSLNEIVHDCIDAIAPPENIEIIVEDDLPAIECEKTRITQVFQNLLSNAVKYMDKPQGYIRIGCTEEDGCYRFSVADDGPGIEERGL